MTRGLFEKLISGHNALAHSQPESPRSRLDLQAVLEGFLAAQKIASVSGDALAATRKASFQSLLDGLSKAMDERLRHQEATAEDFNLLEVLRLVGKEVRHTMVLAWLLDRDPRNLGTHAQGALGFKLFLKEFGLPEHYATLPYRTRREVGGNESIVDLEIACRGEFLIHVENKIWASEGLDQTNREWADMKRRATDLAIDVSARAPPLHALFLTPAGTRAINPNFRSISWRGVVRVLDAFAERARPPDVRLFAAHYARTLRRFIVTRDSEGDSDAQRPAE